MKELYKKKVYAYITREKEGQTQLLIRTHRNAPEAGVHILGGRVEGEETLEQALLRNIREESGLRHVSLNHLVADELVYVKGRNEYQKRHFYHVSLLEGTADAWEYIAERDGEPTASILSYTWIAIENCPFLTDRQGAYIHLVEQPYIRQAH